MSLNAFLLNQVKKTGIMWDLETLIFLKQFNLILTSNIILN